jgi:hypothetical protein
LNPHDDSPDKERGAASPEHARSDPGSGERLTPRLTHEWRWLALVAVGTLVPCVAILVTGRTLSWRDTASLFEPMRPLISESLRHFQLPLWNPYEAAGIPLFAQMMHGVLHPWSIVAALVTPDGGVDLMIVLHVLTGAIGAGVLARALGATPEGASVAGLGYGLSGYLLGLTANLQYLAAGATAPWTIAALRRVGRGSAATIALAAVAVAVLISSGDPQWSIVAAVLGTMLTIEKDGASGAWRALLAVALGGALAAIQLVPAWAMFAETSRSSGLSSADISQWGFNPSRLIEFIVPGLFAGRPGPTPAPVFLWFEGESQYPLPFLPSVFVGIPVLMCAVWGLRGTRPARWCGVAAGVLLWMSLGHRLFAAQALSWIPVWGSFRYAEKLIGPWTLLVTVIAGVGLPTFAARGLERMRPVAWPAAATLIAGAVLLFLAGRGSSGPESWPAGIWALLSLRLSAGLLLAGGALAVLAMAASRYSSDSPMRERWVVALVLATGVLASAAALHAGRRDARDPEPLADLRNTSPVPRVIQPVDQIRLPVSRGFDMFDAAQVVRSASARPSYNVPARIDALVTYTGLLPRRYNELLKRLDALGPARWIAFRRFAVTDVVLTPPLTQADVDQAVAAVTGGTQVRSDDLNEIRVFQVPHTPWAHFATRVREASTEEEAIALTADATARGDDTVILQGAAPATLSMGSVLSIERNADHVRIVADAAADGLLIVADSWWPGWIAEIDGRPVPIHRAEAFLRAIPWPAGHHVLEMRYRPREVHVGAVISSAATAVLAGVVLIALLWREAL